MKKFIPPIEPEAKPINPLFSLNESLSALRLTTDYIELVIQEAERTAFYAAWESRQDHPNLSKEDAFNKWNSIK